MKTSLGEGPRRRKHVEELLVGIALDKQKLERREKERAVTASFLKGGGMQLYSYLKSCVPK